MDDVIQIVGGGAGYAILALSSVVFWRMFRYLEKDRDYWRDKAMRLLGARDEDLELAERTVVPLKKIEKVVKQDPDAETVASIVRAVLKR